jgi:hypothetical protein
VKYILFVVKYSLLSVDLTAEYTTGRQ